MVERCDINQFGDTTRCFTCGLLWDTNDRSPPPCPRTGIRYAPIELPKEKRMDTYSKILLTIGIIIGVVALIGMVM
jgi:hypothetical protein